MKTPKYIENKVNRLERLLNESQKLRCEIEAWVSENGGNCNSEEWSENVVAEYAGCDGIFLEELKIYMENIDNTEKR